MTESFKAELLDNLISNINIASSIKNRSKAFVYYEIANDEELLKIKNDEGWTIDRVFKTKIRLKTAKPYDILFEDKIWTLFAKLGFTVLNKERYFHLPYDKSNENLVQRFNVFAKDKETVLIVECKSATHNTKANFKEDLESMSDKIDGIIKSIKSLFPSEKFKFKYILATNNYAVNEEDLQHLQNINGIHFDENNIEYYLDLFNQLGHAAKYQLLGTLFFGQEIPELDNKIPAVRGEMGGHTYYSFSIEPEKLLKIGYVLHRNKANINMMPTYQRLIKKKRLQEVEKFIDEEKGYFPNSIVISIDTGKKELQFDKANTQVSNTISDVGILHIPKKYRSAYIIDGQHRLYGYSNSIYKDKNTIPVVAFVNLERGEQIRLFMEINENQKSVSKNLRLTLNADLLWDSDSHLDQQKALFSRIAVFLGEDRKSALYDKVSIGEDKKIITSEAIVNALLKTNFFGKVAKHKIEKLGTFNKNDLDTTYKHLSKYIIQCFEYLHQQLEGEWEDENSILMINKGVYAIIRVLSDICDFIKNESDEDFTTHELYEKSKQFLDSIIIFYQNISPEISIELRKRYGGGGDIKYWRVLQEIIRNTFPKFNPEGLDEYIQKEKKEYNEEAFRIIRDIELFMNKDFENKLFSKYGSTWFSKGLPLPVQKKSTELSIEKNYNKKEDENDFTPWDCLHLIDYREIALKNWADLFEKEYTLPKEKKLGGGKEKTKWFEKLNTLRNKNFHSYSVTKEEIEYLRELIEFIINKKVAITLN